ncbi:hypothetical protein LOTGIDRAFT_164345 [Lottia gigantea]|uniref:UPAR/Ly6 domain-containing protein qvr n=1 Tax=Lottia gigantea TaxID=225164 RepID=V4A4X5_LOTGI|nr:hypothetical protein LOTGIDRAFT_164345 [Lottia gigantea]ESO90045.1 hypothetical protein LOTGIDRAFT_164345 [Lottia gigantea]
MSTSIVDGDISDYSHTMSVLLVVSSEYGHQKSTDGGHIILCLRNWGFISDIGKGNENVKHPDVVNCYFCSSTSSSIDHFCADPFNTSHPALTQIKCNGYCAKWVVEKGEGEVRYTRTCSKHMKVKMNINLVCMKERGSYTGHLCFCAEHGCNQATEQRMVLPWLTLLVITSYLAS